MASDDQVINSLSSSIKDLEKTLTRFVAKTEAETKKFETSMGRMGKSAKAAGTAAEAGLGNAKGAAQNLTYQLNDISSTLLGGSSPFQVMVQQGSQVAQVFQELVDSGESVGDAISKAFSGMLGPVALLSHAVIFLAGFAVQFFQEWIEGSEEATDRLETLLETTNKLRESQGLKPVNLAESPASKYLALRQAIRDSQDNAELLAEAIEGINEAIENTPATPFEGELPAVKAMKEAMQELSKTMEEGKPDFLAFARTMEDIITNFGLKGEWKALINKVIDLAAQGARTDEIIKELSKALDLSAKAAEALAKKQEEAAKAFKSASDTIDGMVSPLSELEKLWNAYTLAMDNAASAQDRLNVQTKTYLGLADMLSTAQGKYTGIVENAGKVWTNYWTDFHEGLDAHGADIDRYLKQINRAEGTGQNPHSTAVGTGQFINSTWIGMIKKHRPDLAAAAGFSDANILELRKNKELATEMIVAFANDNAKTLQSFGIEATTANMHLAHFLGAQGAVKVLKAAPGTPASELVSADAIRGNPVLQGGATRETILAYARSRAEATVSTKAEKSAVDSLIVSMKAEIATAERQNAINADGKTTVDEKTFALLKEQAMTKLLEAAQKDGTTVTAEQRKAFDELATAMANVGLSAEQIKTKNAEATKALNDQRQAAEQLAQQYNDMASEAISGFINDLRHGVSAGEAFSKVLDNIIGQLIEMAVKQMVLKSGFGAFMAGFGALKSGGIIGFTGSAKSSMSPIAFAGAPRFLPGGVVGTDPGAVPIIAHRGEIVIPVSAMRKAATQTKQPEHTSIDARSNIKVDIANGTGKTNTTASGGVAFADMLDKAVQLVIVRESRPGGLLRRPQGAR